MSLRIKTLLIVSAVILCLLAALYSAAALILPPSFAHLEQQHVHHDLSQVAAVLHNEGAALALTVQDWAAWDDTYQFIEDGNQAYIAANLPDQTFVDLHINLMVFRHRSGRIVFGKQYDRVDAVSGPIPLSLAPYLAALDPLQGADAPPRLRAGLLGLPEGPLLVAAHPILMSDDQGPARGTLIVGRWLDAAEVARLSQLAHYPFRLFAVEAPLAADVRAAYDRLTLDAPLLAQPLDNGRIAGYSLLADVTGTPGVLAQVEQPRLIVQQGRAAMNTLALALVVAGLVFGATSLLVTERLILRRLERVEAEVRRIRVDGEHAARITIAGHDELGRLAAALNETLDALQEAQGQLRASEARYRAVVEDQTELICRWRPDTTLTFANSAYRRAFAALQQPLRHLVPSTVIAEDRELVAAHLAQLSVQATSATIELRVALPDGRIRWQQWVDRPIVDQDGQLLEVQSVGRDITERRRVEEEQRNLERRMLEAQRLESLGALAGAAAHDFNNLLAIILGSSGLLLHELPAGSALRPSTERIEHAARRAADLTEQLLAYGGRGRLLVQPLDLNVLLADLQPLLGATIAKSSDIVYNLAPGRLPILADGGQIRQLVMNLVINGVEAVGYGEGRITVVTSLSLSGARVGAAASA